MSTTPTLSCRQVIRRLRKRGFVVDRQSGSHKQFRHPDGRGTTVADHGADDVPLGTLKKIAADIGVSLSDFLRGK